MKTKAFDNLYDKRFPCWTPSADLNAQKELLDRKKKELKSLVLSCAVMKISLFLLILVLYKFNPALILPIIGIICIGMSLLIRDITHFVPAHKEVCNIEKSLNQQGYRYYYKAREAFLSIFDENNPRKCVYPDSIDLEDPKNLIGYLEDIAREKVKVVSEINTHTGSGYSILLANERALALRILTTISYLGLMNTNNTFFSVISEKRGFEEAIENRTKWLYRNLRFKW